jgi:hypothetical protein
MRSGLGTSMKGKTRENNIRNIRATDFWEVEILWGSVAPIFPILFLHDETGTKENRQMMKLGRTRMSIAHKLPGLISGRIGWNIGVSST